MSAVAVRPSGAAAGLQLPRRGPALILARTGLVLAAASVVVDFGVGRGVSAPVTAPVVAAAAAAALLLVGFDALASGRRLSGWLIASVALHAAVLVAYDRPFDGSPGVVLLAHVLVVGFVGAAPRLGEKDVFVVLTVMIVLSLLTPFVLGSAAFSVDERSLLSLGRLTGVFGHPNLTGMAGALVVVLAWRHPGRRLACVVAIGCLALTASLTGMVAAAAGVASLMLGSSAPARRALTTAVVVALAAPALVAFLAPEWLTAGLFTGRGAVWLWVAQSDLDRVRGAGTELFDALRGSWFPIGWYHGHNQVLNDIAVGGVSLLATTAALLGRLRHLVADRRAFAVWTVLAVTCITETPLHLDYPGSRVLLVGLVVIVLLSRKESS